ncbi:hypothetical protein ACFS5J_04385 [Flavobacterium chuncheonense]|uniref:Uncharacterized protein n=1 Tax=Flavobacterium chuncheonense TaxID=2026653 RepID=A0ABW5YJV7_9FLAO
MKPLLKNILAVTAGWIGGSIINMGLLQIGHFLYPIHGVDLNDMDALAKIMPTLEVKHFIFPFLAHALGTLTGAILAGIIAVRQKMKFAIVIGMLFLIGGIMVNSMLPGPIWFTFLDIVVAYIPMAWIGGIFAERISSRDSLDQYSL